MQMLLVYKSVTVSTRRGGRVGGGEFVCSYTSNRSFNYVTFLQLQFFLYFALEKKLE